MVHGGVNINEEQDPTFMKKIESPGMLELLFLAHIHMNFCLGLKTAT